MGIWRGRIVTTTSSKLEAGALIAGRYRAEEALPGDRARRAYSGTDEQSGQRVLLLELSANDAGSLGPVLRIEHAHLARVLDIVQMMGTAVIAVENVAGVTLDAHMSAGTGHHKVECVRAILRVADAVSAIHAAGGAHGCLRPEAIVYEPSGRPGPVVAFAAPLIGLSPYRSPDRGEAGRPSEADDAWAVAGLLYSMLTGKQPPVVGIASEADLVPLGVRDEVLRAALVQALAADPSKRNSDLRPLKRELARWFVDHAGEEPSHVGPLPAGASRPPPLPPASGPPAAAQPAAPPVSGPAYAPTGTGIAGPRRRSKLLVPLAIAGIVLGVGAAWGVSALRKPQVRIVETPSSASAAAPSEPSGHAIDLTEVPVTSTKGAATGDKMATCAAGYLPKGAFVATPDMQWLCGESDPRVGAERLRTSVVYGGAQREITEAMKIFSRIGWYDMAAFAVVRSGCCPDAKPIELPAPVEPCPDMGQALRDIAKATLASQSVDEPLERYTKSANCEISANRAYLYKHNGKPQYYQEQAFRELIKAMDAD